MNDENRKSQIADKSFANHGEAPEPSDPLHGVTSGVQGGSIFEMQTGLFSLGRNRALDSGTTEPRPEDILSLENHARSMARQTYRDKYDPAQNVHDAMHEAEYRRDQTQREEAEKSEQHAAANLRDAEIALAHAPKAGPKPRAHSLVVPAFVVTITITIAPTIHDSIFIALGDDLLNWFLSCATAAFVGFVLTLAILHGRRSKWTWIGVAAGIVMGVGLCSIRLSGVTRGSEAMIAVGLTIMEIAAVWLLEYVASSLRGAETEWLPKHSQETKAIAARDAAQAEKSRRQDRVRDLDESIAKKIAFVADRHTRNIHLPELEAVAIKAVLDGYNAGIAENTGRLRGVVRRSA